MREVEQARLLSSFRHFDLKFIASFPKRALDPAGIMYPGVLTP